MTRALGIVIFCIVIFIAVVKDEAGGGNEKGMARSEYVVGARPRDIVCGDFNGDRLIDIATVLKKEDVSVLLDDGRKGYMVSNYKGLPHNTSLAAADLNGDGYMDLVALTEGMFGPFFLNDGKGKFTPSGKALPAFKTMSWHLASADINNDRLTDFIAVSSTEGDLLLFVNEGGLKFTRKEISLSGMEESLYAIPEKRGSDVKKNIQADTGANQESLKVGETNKDASKDLPAGEEAKADKERSEQRQLAMIKRRESTQAVRSQEVESEINLKTTLAESKDEETPDTEDSNEARGRRVRRNLFRHKSTVSHIGGFKDFAIADLNNDGYMDIVLPSYAKHRIYVGLNDKKGGFSFSYTALPADVIKDDRRLALSSVAVVRDKEDSPRYIAIAVENPGILIIFNNEKGSLTLNNSLHLTHSPILRIASADLNGDGFDDLVVSFGAPLPVDNKSPVAVYLQDGKGKFSLVSEDRSGGYAGYIVACRLGAEKDGYSLIMSNIHENSITVLKLPDSLSSVKTRGE